MVWLVSSFFYDKLLNVACLPLQRRTGYRQDIIWVAPVLSGLFTGFGIMTIFLNCLSYLIDSYLML